MSSNHLPHVPASFQYQHFKSTIWATTAESAAKRRGQINTAKKNAEFGHFRPATANPPIHQSTGKWVSFARAFRANQREIRSRSYATRLDGGDETIRAMQFPCQRRVLPLFFAHISVSFHLAYRKFSIRHFSLQAWESGFQLKSKAVFLREQI